MMLIYEFETEQEALNAINAINNMAMQYWQKQGYTIIPNSNSPVGYAVVGKRDGVDDPKSAQTTTWDVVRESPNNTFYFTSLSNDERFKKGTEQLKQAGFSFIEKELPHEWATIQE